MTLSPTTVTTSLHRPAAPAVAPLGTILGVWAHPDDESYLSAGVMAAAAANGQHVAVVHATLGEHGTADPVASPPDRLAIVRRHELTRALGALGVRSSHVLGHPDGGCAEIDPLVAVDQLLGVIDRVRPDTIVTFGPDGMTGHPDHRAVSRWVDLARVSLGGSVRVLHSAVTTGWAAAHRTLNDEIGAFGPGLPAAVDPARVALSITLDDELLDRKMSALRAHRSQTAALEAAMGAVAYRNWWATESFVDAPGSD